MRIAIVNDTVIAVEAMRRLLVGHGRHEVAWTAGNGADAVRCCAEDRPDLLLMDLIMPDLDGVEATRRIMANSPCPILVVSDVMETNSAKVFEAMGAGALDAVRAPVPSLNGNGDGAASFLAKIDSVARLIGSPVPPTSLPRVNRTVEWLVAIGSSAGGPAALSALLRDLPEDFPAAVVVVQHVDVQFAAGLAKWLDDSSILPVRIAESGDSPAAGEILVACSNDHLVFESSWRLGYTPNPVEYSYRPSINAFFESAARRWRNHIAGVLLTGMGSDGASGLKGLRNLGHHTIAQDRATSAVYGMPKAAAEMKAAVEILPLAQIANALCRRISLGKDGLVTPTP